MSFLPRIPLELVARIYLGLALFAVLLLLVNLMLGLVRGDFGKSSQALKAATDRLDELEQSDTTTRAEFSQQRVQVQQVARTMVRQREKMWPHVWLGITASLISLLVNSISVTYFIGTARWCREVAEAYRMEETLPLQSQALKRTTFPWSLIGILLTLLIAGLGAASDPYSSSSDPSGWVIWHWTIALGGIVVIGISFFIQVGCVGRNYEIIQKILTEAERIRAARQESPAEET